MGSSEVLIVLLLVISIAVFFIFRFILLWYWRVNEHIANQEMIIKLLKDIRSNTDKPSVNVGSRNLGPDEDFFKED